MTEKMKYHTKETKEDAHIFEEKQTNLPHAK